MKKWKKYSILILFILALALITTGYLKSQIKNERIIDVSLVEEKISKIVEISTVKYDYTNVVIFKDSKKLSGLNIPFTSKRFMLKYSGYLKAGIDLKGLKTEIIDENSIKLTMDKPKIFDNVILEEDIFVYDEKGSIFNKLSFKDLYDALIEEKTKIEQEVIDKGFLKEAEEGSKEMLILLLENTGFRNIDIVFK